MLGRYPEEEYIVTLTKIDHQVVCYITRMSSRVKCVCFHLFLAIRKKIKMCPHCLESSPLKVVGGNEEFACAELGFHQMFSKTGICFDFFLSRVKNSVFWSKIFKGFLVGFTVKLLSAIQTEFI